MTRLFLFQIIDDIRQAGDKKERIDFYMKQDRFFKKLIDITYNKKYNWEFDQKYTKESRSKREFGGVSNQWHDVVRLINNILLKTTVESPKFSTRLDRLLEQCNQKDIDILLGILKRRNIKYILKKSIYKWYPELNDGDQTE